MELIIEQIINFVFGNCLQYIHCGALRCGHFSFWRRVPAWPTNSKIDHINQNRITHEMKRKCGMLECLWIEMFAEIFSPLSHWISFMGTRCNLKHSRHKSWDFFFFFLKCPCSSAIAWKNEKKGFFPSFWSKCELAEIRSPQNDQQNMPCRTPYVLWTPHRLSIGCHTTQANYAIHHPPYLYLPYKYSGPAYITQCNTQAERMNEWMKERTSAK